MKRLCLLSILLLVSTNFLRASNTTVTGTLTDADGTVWSNCTVTAIFRPTPGVPGPYTVGGVPFNTNPTPVTCNGSGAFTIVLTDNASISPAKSTWNFTITPNVTTQSVQVVGVTVTGGALSLTAILSAALGSPRINATSIPKAYTDNEVVLTPNTGGIYYNVISKLARIWDGTSWGTIGGTGTGGYINVLRDCPGVIGDGVTDDYAALQACINAHPSSWLMLPNTRGDATTPSYSYYSSQTLTINTPGTILDGGVPSLFYYPTAIKFAPNTTGIKCLPGGQGSAIQNLTVNGQYFWSVADLTSYRDWTPAMLTDGSVADGILLQCGEPILRNVQSFGFAGNCIRGQGDNVGGAVSDFAQWENVTVGGGCGGYGALLANADANVFRITGFKSYSNMLGGAYDWGQAQSMWLGFGSHADAQSNVSAGVTQAVSSYTVSGGVGTIVTTAALANGVQSNGTWVALTGCGDGTFNFAAHKLLSVNTVTKTITFSTSHADGNDGSGTCVVGTAASADIQAYLIAKVAGAGTPPIAIGCFTTRDAALGGTWVHPYCESTSAPPRVGTSTIIIGGQVFSQADAASFANGAWIGAGSGSVLNQFAGTVRYRNYANATMGLQFQPGNTATYNTVFTWSTHGGTYDYWQWLHSPASETNSTIGIKDMVNAGNPYLFSGTTTNGNATFGVTKAGGILALNSGIDADTTFNSAGNQAKISSTGTALFNGGSANHAVCWKNDGKTLGYCSDVVAAGGTCTCN